MTLQLITLYSQPHVLDLKMLELMFGKLTNGTRQFSDEFKNILVLIEPILLNLSVSFKKKVFK